MINIVQRWLELIGTPTRAALLLKPWSGDPAIVLLGSRGAERAYASPYYRPALDSWDCGLTTRRDLTIWARHIADGKYDGPVALHVTTVAGDSEVMQARISLWPDRISVTTAVQLLLVAGQPEPYPQP